MPTVVHSDTEIVDHGLLVAALEDLATVEARDTDTEAAVAEAAAVADVLVLDDRAPVTASVLDAAARRAGEGGRAGGREGSDDAEPAGGRDAPAGLALIARAGTGVDAVDVGAAAARGIPVTSVPHYGTESVATHAVGLLLAAWRAIPERDRSVREGAWDWRVGRPISRLAGATLGIVGFGAIGRQTASFLAGFDLEVLAYDPYLTDAEVREAGAERVGDLHDLLPRVDALSIHAPLTDETAGMVGADELAALPDHAVLVNTARGGIVDEDALAAALEAGELRAAGLDVLETEPPGTDARDDDSLLHRDDVVTTPHAAWYSASSRRALNETVARQVRAALTGEQPEHVVDPDAEWL